MIEFEFPRGHRERKPIFRRGQRAGPAEIVRTGGILGVIKVQNDLIAKPAQVGAFDRVV